MRRVIVASATLLALLAAGCESDPGRPGFRYRGADEAPATVASDKSLSSMEGAALLVYLAALGYAVARPEIIDPSPPIGSLRR